MNILDIIAKKRDKEELTKEEIEYFVKAKFIFTFFIFMTAIPPKSSPETLFSLKTYYVLCRNQI